MCGLKDYLIYHKYFRSQRQARLRDEALAEEDDVIISLFDFSMNYLLSKKTIMNLDTVELLNIVAFYNFEHIRLDI